MNILELEDPTTRAIFYQTNRLVEKCSRIIILVVTKITPLCWLAPQTIASFVTYFTTDLGNDAFELPVTMW